MLCLLCDICLVRSLVEFVTATTELMDAMILEAQLGVRTETEVGVEAERLVVQLWQLGVAIAIIVITLTSASLSISINARLVVVGYQRDIARRHIIKRIRTSLRHECMTEGCRIADRFLGDDIDGSTDGRCTEEGRTSTTNHLHTVYHVGRYLLQAIHTVERREHRARIHQDLGIVTIETIDAHLGKATVLAVVLRTHTRLEVKSLRQASRLCDVK